MQYKRIMVMESHYFCSIQYSSYDFGNSLKENLVQAAFIRMCASAANEALKKPSADLLFHLPVIGCLRKTKEQSKLRNSFDSSGVLASSHLVPKL